MTRVQYLRYMRHSEKYVKRRVLLVSESFIFKKRHRINLMKLHKTSMEERCICLPAASFRVCKSNAFVVDCWWNNFIGRNPAQVKDHCTVKASHENITGCFLELAFWFSFSLPSHLVFFLVKPQKCIHEIICVVSTHIVIVLIIHWLEN